MKENAPPAQSSVDKPAASLSGAMIRQHADLANTLAGVAGVPAFTLSVPEAHALGRFLMVGHREDFSDEEEEAWGLLNSRLHHFLVSLQEKEKTDG